MLKPLFHKIGVALSNYLMQEVGSAPLTTPTDMAELKRCVKPGDVILIEGSTRVSGPIKYLTQSSWSHAALFVGPVKDNQEASGEPHVLVEADLIAGVRSSPLSKCAEASTRICRPFNLRDEDLVALIAFAIDRIGCHYDLHNLFDLLRYLMPTPPIPSRLRRRFISIGAASPSQALCSTLLAQAFQAINYPILPTVEFIDDEKASSRAHRRVVHEILHIRNSALYVPRDFDISPYFEIIKPTIEKGFDYKHLTWQQGTRTHGMQ
ncbi:YiiX/YebB-like N1pC/P60 family cysteine hydrolase [Methylocystis sp. IM2]|uniref:YiiX/YebB-like N1pC/P60 family cysteine hydrolase n=1 Tax=Methylocystis sp. IM2 TaxID=3136563 RepID=UPI0030F9F298